MIAMKQKNKKSIISKRLWIILPLFLLLSLSVQAQPKWAKKASKSVFTLKTFDAQGSLLGSGNGRFIAVDNGKGGTYNHEALRQIPEESRFHCITP